ncbi:MAG: WD40 repeat domain-containing protein [Pseudomonas sp.]|nr:WD40 repeat domain-containing protein [Pseudomonas sp.]
MTEHIASGAGAPATAPTQHNAHYLDVKTGALYIAKGTLSVDDWVKIPARGVQDFKPSMRLTDRHDGKTILYDGSEDGELPLDAQDDGGWWDGARVVIRQIGAGRLKVAVPSGVRIQHPYDLMPKSGGRHTEFELNRITKDLWAASGVMAPWEAPEPLPIVSKVVAFTNNSPYLAVYNPAIWTLIDSSAATSITEFPVAMRVSPDGKHLAVRSENSTFVLNIADWSPVTLGTPVGGGSLACFTRDGKYLILDTYETEAVVVYRTDTWEKVSLTGAPSGFIAHITPSTLDQKFVVLKDGSGALVFDADTPAADPVSLSVSSPKFAEFSPDGRTLCIATSQFGSYVHLYETFDWTTLDVTLGASQGNAGFNSGNGTASSVKFSPDGKYLAIAGTMAPFFTVLKTEDWSSMNTSGPSSLNHFAWATDSSAVALVGGMAPRMKLYKVSDWANPVTRSDTNGNEKAVAFSPDGVTLAVPISVVPYLKTYNAADLTDATTQPAEILSTIMELYTSHPNY